MIEAIRSGRLGRTAVCYIEWSSPLSQKVLIDWTVIQNDASVHTFSSQFADTPRAFADLTSTSGEIDFAMTQIERAPFRVIDISGDSDDNNAGREVMDVRDEAPPKVRPLTPSWFCLTSYPWELWGATAQHIIVATYSGDSALS